MSDMLTTAQGQFCLDRFPADTHNNLRAWDAADEYLLSTLAEQCTELTGKRLLIINDGFGALSCALAEVPHTAISDSFVAQQGARENLVRNGIGSQQVTFLDPLTALEGQFDIVLIKVQKSLSQLEDQLHKIRAHIHPQTLLIAGAMAKMIHRSTLNLFSQIIGPTHTSLAVKKARLIFATLDPELDQKPNPYPSHFSHRIDGQKLAIHNHANVFSRSSLDIGARFMIEHIPSLDKPADIIDLACGNGVLGVAAAIRNPEASIVFCDESHMAVASAKMNFKEALANRDAQFVVDDCLSTQPDNSADLILNNPPFHQQNVIGDFIAWQMFKQSLKVLRPGGELWVVGNRHLNYHSKLKKLFGNCRTEAANNKFVILVAVKRG